MENRAPLWISTAQAIWKLFKSLGNRGEVVIPFLESVPEASRPAVESFITNTGATAEDIAGFNSFDEFLSGYKPKAPQSSNPDWVATLPEEQRPLIGVKGWKTPADVIKGYSELEKYMGHDKIPAPRKGKDGRYEAGEFERVMTALGMPKDPAGYVLPQDFKVPEGVQIDADTLNDFKVQAHKMGILPEQFNGLMGYFVNFVARGNEAIAKDNEKKYNETNLALRTKWGNAYDTNAAVANRILRSFASKEQGETIVRKYGNDPIIVELFANIGEQLGEETLQRVGMAGAVLGSAEAQSEIMKIQSDPKHPYFDKSHPQHKYWVDRMYQLQQMAG